jgi:hypothetical protein
MLTLEKIRKALKDRRPTFVAKATGLHINTILSIRDDPKCDPKYSTLQALSDYLMGQQGYRQHG